MVAFYALLLVWLLTLAQMFGYIHVVVPSPVPIPPPPIPAQSQHRMNPSSATPTKADLCQAERDDQASGGILATSSCQ
jgi:hypothetical protein